LYLSADDGSHGSERWVVMPTPTRPAALGNLAAAVVSASQVNLSWTNNSTNETGFKLFYSTDGVNWVWFAQLAPTTTTYTWWGASPGTGYSFLVTATSAIGDSAPSNTASATTPLA
jgi:titin